MTQVSIQDVFLKKSGFFRSITILESPQLGIKKKEIKIIVCKIVLKRPKNKPFARDFFFIKNERARCWILYLAFNLVNYNNKLNFNVFTTNIWCSKSIQENRVDYSISEILFTYLLPSSRGNFEQELFVFPSWLSPFLAWLFSLLWDIDILWIPSSYLTMLVPSTHGGSLNVRWGTLFWS